MKKAARRLIVGAIALAPITAERLHSTALQSCSGTTTAPDRVAHVTARCAMTQFGLECPQILGSVREIYETAFGPLESASKRA